MKSRVLTAVSVLIVVAFVVFMVVDFSFSSGKKEPADKSVSEPVTEDMWHISGIYDCKEGSLKAVAAGPDGDIFIGGESFITRLTGDLFQKWTIETEEPVTALSWCGQTLYASTREKLLLVGTGGEITGEWGPYESSSLITSVSSSDRLVAFADAYNKRIFLLNKEGEVINMIGLSGHRFIIPSPYFDVLLRDNTIYTANTGMHRVEEWTADGRLTDTFGVAGLAHDAFCGCCNPAHFTAYGNGFITAEKGINRIKILALDGGFVESVSSVNNFTPSVPLDVAAHEGRIYGANAADSRLYVFARRQSD